MTSLSEQLRRLAAPQTSNLLDSKKRPSILFDVKEAANKDRETIYDIGLSGLHELIKLNPSFLQFEQTIFDRTAKDFERSVETSEVNKLLNKSIKKFLSHLSPYFQLQPAHKCLEWLIRRFRIHDFNKDDFLALILPYHETRMFVRCIQIMRLNDHRDPWNWLQPIQRPGIPLSKQLLLKQAATDNHFLKFICKMTLDAVKELDVKAYTLQAMFGFYCSTVLGALDISPQVTDIQISNIYNTLAKGLSSNITDFCAASLMITGQIVAKTKLSLKFLDAIVLKLSKIAHPALQIDANILMILIYQTQNESIKMISNESLQIIVASKWIASSLGKIYSDGINIIPLYVPLMSACLKNVQIKGESWQNCKSFCEKLLLEVIFTGNEADDVTRCILDAYILRDKDENNVITIESDDENEIALTDDNIDVNVWYSDLLKNLDRLYPEIFDKVTKEILQEQNTISNSKKKSLKTVLGFLFTAACSADGATIFENLYHFNEKRRVEAVKYLVKNLEKFCISDDSKDLLKNSIGERLNDDSPVVVYEVLKFQTSALVRIVGHQALVDKLLNVLTKSLLNIQKWKNAANLALAHLTSNLVWKGANTNAIFLCILPFLFPQQSLEIQHTQQILNSPFADENDFLQRCRHNFTNSTEVVLFVHKQLESKIGLPNITAIIDMIKSIQEKEFNIIKAYYSVLLLTYSLPKECDPKIGHDVLNIINKSSVHKSIMCVAQSFVMHSYLVRTDSYPIDINLMCIRSIFESTDFSAILGTKYLDFAKQTNALSLAIQIFDILITGLFTDDKNIQVLYNAAMVQFLDHIFPVIEYRIEFCSNFFIGDLVDECQHEDHYVIINPVLQIRSMRFFNSMINQLKEKKLVKLNLYSFVRILCALSSNISAVRVCAFETLQILSTVSILNPSYAWLINNLLQRREEIILDANQLALILYRIFCPTKLSNFKKDAKYAQPLLDELMNFVANSTEPNVLRSSILDILKHVNNIEILKKVSNTALDVLPSTEQTIKTNPVLLNKYESLIVKMILFRFNFETIDAIKLYDNCLAVVLKSLENYNLTMHSKDKPAAVSALAMDLFKSDLFDKLSEKHKILITENVVYAATFSDNIDVIASAGKFMKRVEINANGCLEHLLNMQNVQVLISTNLTTKRRSVLAAVSSDILNTIEWKCGITWLEYLQNKHKLLNAHVLIPSLFGILNRCLELEDQSPVEYTKQLTLGCILHCCKKISPDGIAKRDLLPDKVFKIDLVVQCIRGTQNPHTHHHALQLLCHTAAMIPELVLLNMMNIFTFMGSSVVRRDDAYTYQIISNIIKSIIPTLTKANESKTSNEQNALVIPVLRVFSGIILDVPEHRRLRLYEELLRTLGVKQYLWMFLIQVFESHVCNFSKEAQSSEIQKTEDIRRIVIAVDLVNKFDCSIVLETCSKLMEFLYKQPFVIVSDTSKMDIDITDTSLFKIENYTDKQLRHFRYTTLQFIIQLTKHTSEFVPRIASLDAYETAQLKPYFKNIIVKSLQFLGKVIKTAEQQNTRYWKQFMVHNSYDILEQVLALLSPDMLLQVVRGLLNNIPEVRKKAIELLNKKLQLTDFFVNCDKENMLVLLDPLCHIIESITDEDKLCENATPLENLALQQHALIAFKLLSIVLAKDYPTSFTPLLVILSSTIKKSDEIPTNVLGQLVLCLAEICYNLRAHSISHLSKFMPALGKLLEQQVTNVTAVLPPLLTAIYKIVETLPLFLNPYMVNIIVNLSEIWSKLLNSPDAQKKLNVINKLEAIWKKFALVLPLRVLVPMIDQSYKKLVELRKYGSIGPLMILLTGSFADLTSSDITPYQNELTAFFLRALQFRCDSDLDEKMIDMQETQIIQAFVGLILKLSESSFRPLYYKVYDWAIRNGSSIDRAITFYRLSSRIAEALKSLFVLFANDFIQNAADQLNACNQIEETNTAASGKHTNLIQSIIQTLHNVFMHDSQGFINHHRFDILMQPIVDQLENHIVIGNSHLKKQIPICLAQLAKAASDDTMWKQLNYQILLKTRNNNPDIRLFALEACVEVATIIGTDFLPLLPETIPFLSELLEDENSHVEKHCQKSIQELEQVLGESLQKYF